MAVDWGTFTEWDANVPGPALVNMACVLYVTEDNVGRAVLHFGAGEQLALNVLYTDVKGVFVPVQTVTVATS